MCRGQELGRLPLQGESPGPPALLARGRAAGGRVGECRVSSCGPAVWLDIPGHCGFSWGRVLAGDSRSQGMDILKTCIRNCWVLFKSSGTKEGSREHLGPSRSSLVHLSVSWWDMGWWQTGRWPTVLSVGWGSLLGPPAAWALCLHLCPVGPSIWTGSLWACGPVPCSVGGSLTLARCPCHPRPCHKPPRPFWPCPVAAMAWLPHVRLAGLEPCPAAPQGPDSASPLLHTPAGGRPVTGSCSEARTSAVLFPLKPLGVLVGPAYAVSCFLPHWEDPPRPRAACGAHPVSC